MRLWFEILLVFVVKASSKLKILWTCFFDKNHHYYEGVLYCVKEAIASSTNRKIIGNQSAYKYKRKVLLCWCHY